MNFKWPITIITALAVIATAGTAGATQTLYMSNKDMSQNADEVILGVVKNSNTYTDTQKGSLYTLTTVSVTEWLKGGGEKEIVIRQFGGQSEGKISKVSGDAKLARGEEVVLFLKKGDGVRYMLSLSQSKFVVTTDKNAGKKFVKQDVNDISLWEKDKDGNFAPKKVTATQQPVLLNDFLSEIRGYISGNK